MFSKGQIIMEDTGNTKYQRIVENLEHLPSLPTIVVKLMQIVNSPESSADDAALLIEKDPALTSTLIRMANSAFYGMPRSTSSVSSAVVILGFNTIRSIALSTSIVKSFPQMIKSDSFNREHFWRHSIICALAARIIIKHQIYHLHIDPESAFCAGILHDIGKLIFEQFVPNDFFATCQYAMENKTSIYDAEKKILGITHAEIGRILADKWGLPIDLEHAIVYHHAPVESNQATELVTAIHCADFMAHKVGANLWNEEICFEKWEEANKILKITEDDFNICYDELKNNLDKSDEFLSMINS